MDTFELNTKWEEIRTAAYDYCEGDRLQSSAILSRLQPQAMSDGFLMLTVDSGFLKNYIESHYLNAIKNAIIKLYGEEYVVVVQIDDSFSPRPISSADPSSSLKQESESQNEEKNTQPEKSFSSSFSFENFVIGDSNRMAYQMATLVAENPGKNHFNPLFIYGKSGLGKTHLLHAIQNYIRENLPEKKIIYVDSVEFLSEITEAGAAYDKQKTSFKAFTNRYESADVLLLDDVQNFQGKSGSLDLIFQIFNKLYEQGKQVVLSADRNPKNISLDERLSSRFNGGQTCNIQPPEMETKLGIINNFINEYAKSESENGRSFIDIPNTYRMYIAEISGSNIRELKSAVTKVVYEMQYNQNCTLENIKSVLENHFSGGVTKKLTVGDIQKELETFYKISHSDMVGVKRNREIVYARQIGIFLCRQLLDLPLSEIAKMFNRDHSTAIHSIEVIEDRYKNNRDCQEEIEVIEKMIRDN